MGSREKIKILFKKKKKGNCLNVNPMTCLEEVS